MKRDAVFRITARLHSLAYLRQWVIHFDDFVVVL